MGVTLEIDPEDSRIGWIRIRTEKINLLNRQLMDDLENALLSADRDEEIHAILITGDERSFCAGADIKEIANLSFEDGVKWFSRYYRIIDLLRTTSKPTIAAVKGICVGGGNEIAMACDLVVAGKSARFGQPELRVGSTALGLGVQMLPLIVGEKRAREILFTAKILSAEDAFQIGLINRVVVDEEVEEEARKLAVQILDNMSPQAFRIVKSAFKFWTDLAMLNLQLARDITAMVWASEEFRERSREFLEKKKFSPKRFWGVTD
ncbi:enoyl-CoA hydratase/isomerase family protein [Archaeoglobus neptunius]|uniref:enoyl-CoA hydratase/isomerase family protein n=1 Tax=Archaeoglobus neptunius TaxID=2798580 RepID=UPI001925E6E8|nr:enoyl-CoA hydratase/isomerase family protein [Archaeoglobus neptunius]